MTTALEDLLHDIKSSAPAEKLKDLFHAIGVGLGVNNPKAELTLTLIFVDLAMIDDEFHQTERAMISKFICSMFGVSEAQADSLIKRARKRLKKGSEISGVKTTLKEYFSFKERIEIVNMLEKLLNADGIEHPFERDLKSRYAELLGVPE